MKMFTFSITLLLLSVATLVGSMFPRSCFFESNGEPRVFTNTWHVCCPIFQNSICGSAQGRGSCVAINPSGNVTADEHSYAYFFSYACQCYGKFSGHDCGSCIFGWTGQNCDKPKPTVTRRDMMALSVIELQRYHAMMNYCNQKIDDTFGMVTVGNRGDRSTIEFRSCSYYQGCVYMHYLATRPYLANGRETGSPFYAHGSTAFPFWHRYWLLTCERQLQRCMQDDTIAFLVYRWELDSGCLPCHNDYFGQQGVGGSLSEFTIYSQWGVICANNYPYTICIMGKCPCEQPKIVRLPGLTWLTRKPSFWELNRCLNMSFFDTDPFTMSSVNSFRQCIENDHNGFHTWCGGTMAQVPWSPSDPLFASHHANIDYWLELFIRAKNLTPEDYPNNNNIPYGHKAYDCILPGHYCNYRNRDMLANSNSFSYIYEFLVN